MKMRSKVYGGADKTTHARDALRDYVGMVAPMMRGYHGDLASDVVRLMRVIDDPVECEITFVVRSMGTNEYTADSDVLPQRHAEKAAATFREMGCDVLGVAVFRFIPNQGTSGRVACDFTFWEGI